MKYNQMSPEEQAEYRKSWVEAQKRIANTTVSAETEEAFRLIRNELGKTRYDKWNPDK